MGIFLVPATPENLEQSIDRAVPESMIKRHLTHTQVSFIKERAGSEGFRCWAMSAPKKGSFAKMHHGDDVYFSTKGTGLITHYGQVIAKVHSLALGKELWPYVLDKPWEYIYFLRNVTRIRFNKSDFVQVFGYKANFLISGTTRVSDTKIKEHYDKYYNKIAVLDLNQSVDDFEDINPSQAEGQVGLNVVGKATHRRGQAEFAKKVKTNYGFTCAITGIAERSLLIAGHILPWGSYPDHRVDPSNGICLSPFYDRTFEKGFFTLDKRYQVVISNLVDKNKPLGQILYQMSGQKIRLPKNDPPRLEFLEKHRDTIFLR